MFEPIPYKSRAQRWSAQSRHVHPKQRMCRQMSSWNISSWSLPRHHSLHISIVQQTVLKKSLQTTDRQVTASDFYLRRSTFLPLPFPSSPPSPPVLLPSGNAILHTANSTLSTALINTPHPPPSTLALPSEYPPINVVPLRSHFLLAHIPVCPSASRCAQVWAVVSCSLYTCLANSPVFAGYVKRALFPPLPQFPLGCSRCVSVFSPQRDVLLTRHFCPSSLPPPSSGVGLSPPLSHIPFLLRKSLGFFSTTSLPCSSNIQPTPSHCITW